MHTGRQLTPVGDIHVLGMFNLLEIREPIEQLMFSCPIFCRYLQLAENTSSVAESPAHP